MAHNPVWLLGAVTLVALPAAVGSLLVGVGGSAARCIAPQRRREEGRAPSLQDTLGARPAEGEGQGAMGTKIPPRSRLSLHIRVMLLHIQKDAFKARLN